MAVNAGATFVAEVRACYRSTRWLLAAVFLLYLVTTIGFYPADKYGRRDMAEFLASIGCCTWLVLPFLLMLRRDCRNRWTVGFPEPSPALPSPQHPPIAIIFITRFAFLWLVCALVESAPWILLRVPDRGISPFIPLHAYLIVQLLAWTRQYIRGIGFVIPVIYFVIPLPFTLPAPSVERYLTVWASYAEGPEFTALLLCHAIVTLAICLRARYLQRRNKHCNLLSLMGIETALLGPQHAHPREISGSLESLTWHEQRRIGLLLPLLTWIIFTAIFARYVFFVRPRFHNESWQSPREWVDEGILLQSFPLIALMLAAFFSGIIMQRDRWRHPPIPSRGTRQHALARLFAFSRILMWTVIPVCLLSVAGFLLGNAADREVLASAYWHGEASIADLGVILLGPCLVATLCAWIALHLTTRLGLIVVALLLIWLANTLYLGMGRYLSGAWLYDFLHGGGNYWRRPDYWGFAIWMLGLPAIIGGALFSKWHRKLLRAGGALALITLWAFCTATLYVCVPEYTGVQDSTALLGVSVRDVLRLCIALAPASLLLLPFLASMRVREATVRTLPSDFPEISRFMMKQPWVWLTLSFLLFVAGSVISTQIGEPTCIRAMRDRGMVTNDAEMQALYNPGPRQENGILLIQRAAKAYQPLPQDLSEIIRLEKHESLQIPPGPLPHVIGQITTEHLQFNRPARELVHAALAFPRIRARLLFQGDQTSLHHLTPLSTASRLLAMETVSFQYQGQTEKVVQTILELIKLSTSLEAEPFLVSQYYRTNIIARALDAFERAAGRMDFSREQLVRLQQAFKQEQEQTGRTIRVGLCMDAYTNLHNADRLYEKPTVNEYIPVAVLGMHAALSGKTHFDAVAAASYVRRAIEASGMPSPNMIRALTELEQSEPTRRAYLVSRSFTDYSSSAIKEFDIVSRARAAMVVCAIERFQLDHKDAIPNELRDLIPDHLRSMPKDPYREDTMEYILSKDGSYTVFSLGFNRTYDRGIPPERGHSKLGGDVGMTVYPLPRDQRASVNTGIPAPDNLETSKTRVEIVCGKDSRERWRAVLLAQGLLAEFGDALEGVTLKPAERSAFEVYVNGTPVWSRKEGDSIPQLDDVTARIQSLLEAESVIP